ncbi:hypothetical protein C8J57DRAFT_1722844 [Mycena rebaudengoi]|nr:hypothetical protein C8J57DRAFT_1722844 [Mycena rebaudengoi]
MNAINVYVRRIGQMRWTRHAMATTKSKALTEAATIRLKTEEAEGHLGNALLVSPASARVDLAGPRRREPGPARPRLHRQKTHALRMQAERDKALRRCALLKRKLPSKLRDAAHAHAPLHVLPTYTQPYAYAPHAHPLAPLPRAPSRPLAPAPKRSSSPVSIPGPPLKRRRCSASIEARGGGARGVHVASDAPAPLIPTTPPVPSSPPSATSYAHALKSAPPAPPPHPHSPPSPRSPIPVPGPTEPPPLSPPHPSSSARVVDAPAAAPVRARGGGAPRAGRRARGVVLASWCSSHSSAPSHPISSHFSTYHFPPVPTSTDPSIHPLFLSHT